LSEDNHTAAKPPRFEPVQELRLAVVFYGGVSLAIYIHGVAQELFNLVRAKRQSGLLGQRLAPSGSSN
jgi:hypothetical protein